MTDELEHWLSRSVDATPDAVLRERVLVAVAAELQKRPVREQRRSWLRRPGVAVAASLLLAVALNAWAFEHDSRRQAAFFPHRTPREIVELVESIESVTDEETALAVRRQLEEVYRHRPQQSASERMLEINRLAQELARPRTS